MSGKTYVGNNSSKSVIPKKIYAGNGSNQAKSVKVVYVGNSSGKAVEVWRNSTLPSTYQKVEYIYNTGGTQYIDTGIKPNSDTSFSVELMRTDNNTSGAAILPFGIINNSVEMQLYLLTTSTKIAVTFNNSTQHDIATYARNQKYVIDYNKNGGKFYVNGTLSSYSTTATFSTMTTTIPLFGYRANNGSLNIAREGLNLYHFQAWQSGVMIRNMYPCYLKSNSQTVGMYDLISGQFYGNSGTGIFYKGPDVN